MALQSRKPGWFLDRLLGRGEQPATDAPAAPPLPPASLPASDAEGRPDFAPAALEPPPPVAPAVVEATPDGEAGPGFAPELRGATLQPIERAPEPPSSSPTGEPARAGGWWNRLRDGMRRTSGAIGEGVTGLFTKRKLDQVAIDELEDVLIAADLGIETAVRISTAVAEGRYDREVAAAEVKRIVAREVAAVLAPVATPLAVDRSRKPFVVLTIGVNGAGKTTTIGKLAARFKAQGLSVAIAAGDTFRAAAVEQLKVWGERVGAPVLARGPGADAAGLAFDALEEARANGTDVLMIDTAGRLQNKAGLMAELTKIIRVIRKVDPDAPHSCLLVLDATVGQNALSQVELFAKAAGVTGIVMTKLDGTARGGILVALAAKFGIPVHFIGVGEGIDDLQPFRAEDFGRALAGLDERG